MRKIIWHYNRLRKLNYFSFVKINLFRKRSGWFIPYRKASCDIHHQSEIMINEGSKFMFNKYDFFGDPFPGYFMMRPGSKLIVNEDFSIFTGGRVLIFDNATLELGSGYINENVLLACRERITIGKEVAISSNVTIMDSDAHVIIGTHHVPTKPVDIGDHVWIGANVTILKGVKIGNGAIIAANSLVNKDVAAKTLIGGVPAKVLRDNVDWA